MGNPIQQNQVQNEDSSPIGKFFNAVQDFIIKNYDIDENELEQFIEKELNGDGIMPVTNQEFFKDSSNVEGVAEKIMKTINAVDDNNKSLDSQNMQNQPEPIAMGGERGENTMERRIYNFKDFVNESKGELFANNILTDLDIHYTINIPTTNMDFIQSLRIKLEQDKDKVFKIYINDYSVDITRTK